MVRRSLVLAVTAGLLLAGPAGAQQRSPLEDPDPVSQVRVKLPGSAAIAAAENAGIDFSGNPERVPDGIETDAIVTGEQLTQLRLMGAELVGPEHEFAWSLGKTKSAAAAIAAAETLPR